MFKKIIITLALMLSVIGTQANAATITSTLGEFSGTNYQSAPYPYYEVGTFNFDLQGANIISATLSGHWGNSIAKTTAHNILFFEGTPVANTFLATPDPTSNYLVPWSYNVSNLNDLYDGQADLSAQILRYGVFRLGETTLTIETTPVPEPTSMLLGLMGVAGAARLRRNKKA